MGDWVYSSFHLDGIHLYILTDTLREQILLSLIRRGEGVRFRVYWNQLKFAIVNKAISNKKLLLQSLLFPFPIICSFELN